MNSESMFALWVSRKRDCFELLSQQKALQVNHVSSSSWPPQAQSRRTVQGDGAGTHKVTPESVTDSGR